MRPRTDFEQQWLNGEIVELPQKGDSRIICEFALPFKSYCEALLADSLRFPTDVGVNLAELDLQSKFFHWYQYAPIGCRRHFNPKKGFVCLFQLYHETHMQLFELQQRIIPPRLRESLPLPPPMQIAGMTWGETLKAG
jgi:hypothetical protein